MEFTLIKMDNSVPPEPKIILMCAHLSRLKSNDVRSLFARPNLDLMNHTLLLLVSLPSLCACLFAFPVYLLLGLVFVLVVMETCCELPQLRLLRQKFYQEDARELDSETTNIIDEDHMNNQMTDIPNHMTLDPLPVISSVSEQAENLRQNHTSVNGNLR